MLGSLNHKQKFSRCLPRPCSSNQSLRSKGSPCETLTSGSGNARQDSLAHWLAKGVGYYLFIVAHEASVSRGVTLGGDPGGVPSYIQCFCQYASVGSTHLEDIHFSSRPDNLEDLALRTDEYFLSLELATGLHLRLEKTLKCLPEALCNIKSFYFMYLSGSLVRTFLVG